MQKGFTRRKLLTGLAIGAGAAAVAGAWPLIGRIRKARKEHIFLIIADAMRADVIGKVVNGREVTPNLNRLAAEGIYFSSAYAAAPFTKPSVASIFSGMYPPGHGVEHQVFSLPDCITLPKFLSGKGYYAIGIVANPFLTAEKGPAKSTKPMDFGFSAGFDYYRSGFGKRASLPEELKVLEGYVGGETMNRCFARAYDPAERSFAKDAAVFVYLHYMDSRQPWVKMAPVKGITGAFHVGPRASEDECYAQDAELIRELLLGAFPKTEDAVERVRAVCLEGCAYADRAIGELLDLLRRKGIYEDSTIIFTADHGDELLEHGCVGHMINLFNTTLAVPLVIKRRGMAHVEVSTRVSNAMILPTVMEWFGSELEHTNLFSLMPYVEKKGLPNVQIFASLFGKDKVIMPDGREAMGHEGGILYFNMAKDPAEKSPLAEDAEALDAMRRERFRAVSLAKEAGVVRRFSMRPWQNPWAESQNKAAAELEKSGKLTAEESARLKSLGRFIPEAGLKKLEGDLAAIKIDASAMSAPERDQLRALGYLH